jgi:hypothetical protein
VAIELNDAPAEPLGFPVPSAKDLGPGSRRPAGLRRFGCSYPLIGLSRLGVRKPPGVEQGGRKGWVSL